MSSEVAKAKSLKAEGNDNFRLGRYLDALSSYDNALTALPPSHPPSLSTKNPHSLPPLLLRPTILSNRAACHLKRASSHSSSSAGAADAVGDWRSAVADCTDALAILDGLPPPPPAKIAGKDADDSDKLRSNLRGKVLYRRARARYALDSASAFVSSAGEGENDDGVDDIAADDNGDHLNLAARDLLSCLSLDARNSDASSLLREVRKRHDVRKGETDSPVARALSGLRTWSSAGREGEGGRATTKKNSKSGTVVGDDPLRCLQILLGHLSNDVGSTSMELGRRGGVPLLVAIARGNGAGAGSSAAGDEEKESRDQDRRLSSTSMTAETSLISIRTHALRVLSAAASHDPFVRTFGTAKELDQVDLARIVVESCGAMGLRDGYGGANAEPSSFDPDVVVAAIALALRLVIHWDHGDDDYDDDDESDDGGRRGNIDPSSPSSRRRRIRIDHNPTEVDGPSVCRMCIAALSCPTSTSLGAAGAAAGKKDVDVRPHRAAIDLLAAWTASDLDAIQAAADAADVHSDHRGSANRHRHHRPTEEEVRRMKPRKLAAHRKREADRIRRNKERAVRNVRMFCDGETGGLTSLLSVAASTYDHRLRREVGVEVGRLVSVLGDDDDVKRLVRSVLGCTSAVSSSSKTEYDEKEEEGGLTIEEIYDEDDEGGDASTEGTAHASSAAVAPSNEKEDRGEEDLDAMMRRGQLTASLLMGRPDVGVWALKDGCSNGRGIDELRCLVRSGDVRAASIASEEVSAAASVEKARPLLTDLVEEGALETLLENDDRDVRSGAASCAAKLGLASKALSSDEGEVIGLLDVAVELLYEEGGSVGETVDAGKKLASATTQSTAAGLSSRKSKLIPESSKASTSIERGIEVLSYLAAKTHVKEEIAGGFRASTRSLEGTALDRLVEIASAPEAGDSVSAYGLANIFALMAVSTEMLRREAFVGKDITPEQYDELQSLGKTEEEKELEKKSKEEDDPMEAVHGRIRKMASANVPRAMVKLMEGASESTLEQLVVAMNRMALEESVRGLMVQQGCLSACLKVEKGEEPTDTRRKIIQSARHCVAKMLVTTNPSLLTVSQRMGSIGPLIQLIRDHEASDLAQFEALLSITNLASVGDETKTRIVAEKGISVLSYAMFSDHEMVRRAATEAMSNMVPHAEVMKHLSDPENLKLWVAFASDFDNNFECSRAAVGCLAMSTQDPVIAKELSNTKHFSEMTKSLLECGNLELMHRILVVLLNMLDQGGKCKESVVATGAGAFCQAYVQSYHDGSKANDLNFSNADKNAMAVTVGLSKEIVKMCN